MLDQDKIEPVAVVILNWNGKKYLQEFLPFLFRSTYLGLKVYVADNGSSDDSIQFLRELYPNVILIDNKRNYGFAGGYNHGLRQVPNDYYVLLNSDVEVTPDWIAPVLRYMDSTPRMVATGRLACSQWIRCASTNFGGWCHRAIH